MALAKDLRAAGARAGLAIDRDTPIEPYLDLLPHFDMLLIMTIKAGFGGQQFLPAVAGQGPRRPPARRRRPPGAAHRGRRRDRRRHHRAGRRGRAPTPSSPAPRCYGAADPAEAVRAPAASWRSATRRRRALDEWTATGDAPRRDPGRRRRRRTSPGSSSSTSSCTASRCVHAGDGQEALDVIEQHAAGPGRGRPDDARASTAWS